jgi:hypothetical protein
LGTLAAAPSSTSSSKPAEKFPAGDPAHLPPAPGPAPHTPLQDRGGFPWAFALAILIIIGVEIGLRATGWPKKIPYDLGLDEYFTAAAHIDRHGPADVAILGSSRARESIDVPQLRRMLETELGRKVRVANYAASGARTGDAEAIIERLLRDPHPPTLIVLGISERDLAMEPGMYDRVPIFWDLSNIEEVWARGEKQNAIENLPTAIRNTIAKYWWTLHYREQIRLRIRQFVTREKTYDSPAAGDNTPWQKINPGRTLASRPKTAAQMKGFIRELHYKRYPDPQLRDSLERLCKMFKNSKTQLIIYEIPIAKPMLKYLPSPRLYEDRYIRTVKRIANANGVRFVRVANLRIRPEISDRDFREPIHMGAKGAKRFTKALGERVIAPTLKAQNAPTTAPATNRAN